MTQWQLQAAKTHLSEVLQKAASSGPQEITVHGKPKAVVLSIEDYQKLTAPKGKKAKPQSFVEFLRASPFYGLDLEIERDRSGPRDIDL